MKIIELQCFKSNEKGGSRQIQFNGFCTISDVVGVDMSLSLSLVPGYKYEKLYSSLIVGMW